MITKDGGPGVHGGPGAPLAGLKVLDLTRLLPGPLCTLWLADLGATVLKVEDTTLGDYTRVLPPRLKNTSILFAALNRRKKSVALDLKSDEGKAIFLQLVLSHDVLIESFRPGVAAKLGIDDQALRKINPRLIYCSLSGYGQDGPMKDLAGHDINYISLSGVLDQMRTREGIPVLPNVQFGDMAGGSLTSVIGILAAIIGQKASGTGRTVDISMLDSTLSLLYLPMASALQDSYPRTGPGHDILSGGSPCYQVYRTKDGRYMSLGAIEKKFWETFCRVIAREDLLPFHLAMGKEGQWVQQELEKIFLSQDLHHWMEKFATSDCCCTPVLTFEEAQEHPQIKARKVVSTASAQAGPERIVTYLACPIKMDGLDSAPENSPRAPAHGEHTREILAGLGYQDELIKHLLERRIVIAP